MVKTRSTAWRKNNLREVKHTLERYLAIVAIIALGVGFFSGLKITRTAMVKNLDTYASDYLMYDFRLISTLGLTEEDVQFFSQQEGLTARGAITMDVIADVGREEEVVLKAHSITQGINRLYIRDGRMPESANECVLDARFFSVDMIGSKVKIAPGNDEDTKEIFAYEEYTVVGLADSVNYLSYDRGTTNIAGGLVYAFVYLPEDGFSADYYTELLIRLDGHNEVYSKDYKDLISHKEVILEEALETRGELRYQDILSEAREKVSDAQKEYDDAYKEYLAEKADAEEELDQAFNDLVAARKEIEEQEDKLKEAEIKIAKGERDYHRSVLDYEEALRSFETEKTNTLAELESKQEELLKSRDIVASAMVQIEASGILDQHRELTDVVLYLEAALAQIDNPESVEYMTLKGQLDHARAGLGEIEATGLIQQYAELENTLGQIETGLNELEKGREEAYLSFTAAEGQLSEAKAQLDAAKNQIERSKKDILAGWEALNEGRAEYENGLKEYEDAKAEAEEAFAEAEVELAEAQKEIDDAWREIEDIPEARVFVLNRNHNIGYVSFENDSSIVDGIAAVLPVFFFLVAALVCLTTMTRMVDEQRTQIGTLKALGYSDGAITRKYIFYSGSAAILGCAIGYVLGTKFFPIAIWEAYSMIYGFSSIEYVFDGPLAVISAVVSLLCSAGVTYVSCKTELLQMPAQLIRPKAPKPGKRVLLEYIPVLWNRIGFLHKVSIRNILRYKRRFFMTVLGIAGCTSLVVGAMGISDSIRNIVNDQFDTIMTYDYDISFTDAQTEKERVSFTQEYGHLLSGCVFVTTDEMEVFQGDLIKKISIVASDDPAITELIGLYFKGQTMPYPGDGTAAISDKLAQEFDLSPGDTVTVRINEIDTVDIKISIIFENYMSNYLFMTGQTYEKVLGKEALYKNAYARAQGDDLYSVSAQLSKADGVASVSVLNDMRIMVDNMMQSLDSIIWLVIICAGALGFVVIYNLNNINITERSREIATIKVIGFYDGETKSYIFRETFILTLIGSFFGLGLGKLLHGFVMDQINVEAVSFKEQIFAASYLTAVLVTFAITLLVSWLLKRKIERINMTESLKSIE